MVKLLPRMEARPWKDGKTVTYRYHPPEGPPVNLGTDRDEAIRKVLDMGLQTPDAGTVTWCWRQYQDTQEWRDLTEGTRSDYQKAAKPLLQVFGAMDPADITPTDCRRYLKVHRGKSPVRANREIGLLRNLYVVAIDHGLADRDPTREVKRNAQRSRTRAVEPAELQAYLAWLTKQGGQRLVIAQMAEFCALAGNRRAEFLQLTWPQVDDTEIRIRRAKQRFSKIVIEVIRISPALADLISRIKAMPRAADCLYLFTTRDGNPYLEDSFSSYWHRLMNEALKAGIVKTRFTFHDLRAYYATQHKQRLGRLPDLHANPATTAHIYDRSKRVKREAI